MRPSRAHLIRWARVLAGAQVAVGVGVSVAGISEGALGGVLYALMYALPLLFIAQALTVQRRRWDIAAGVASLIVGVYFAAIPFGNWSGYSAMQSVFVVAITLPTVLLDLLIANEVFVGGRRA